MTLHGLPVHIENPYAEIDGDRALARLEGALALIAAHAPRTLHRFRRDVRGIVVTRFACRGAFFPEQRVVLTELTFLVKPEHDLPEIASSIVHEGVHARVHATLRRPHTHALAREERLCRLGELAFGARLPDGARVMARARAALALDDGEVAPAIDWREATARVRAVDGHGPVT